MLHWMCVTPRQEQKEVAFENCCGQVPLSVLGQFGVFEALHQGMPGSKVWLDFFSQLLTANANLGCQMMGTNNIPSKNHLWRWKLRYPTLGKGKSMIFLFPRWDIFPLIFLFPRVGYLSFLEGPETSPRTPYDIHEEWLSTKRRWRCRTGGGTGGSHLREYLPGN